MPLSLASGAPSVVPASVFVVVTAPTLPLPPLAAGPFCGLTAADLTASLSVRSFLRLYHNPFLVAQVHTRANKHPNHPARTRADHAASARWGL
jgi:hypothetical protein